MGVFLEPTAVQIELACLSIAQTALLCLLTAERVNLHRIVRKERKERENGVDHA